MSREDRAQKLKESLDRQKAAAGQQARGTPPARPVQKGKPPPQPELSFWKRGPVVGSGLWKVRITPGLGIMIAGFLMFVVWMVIK